MYENLWNGIEIAFLKKNEKTMYIWINKENKYESLSLLYYEKFVNLKDKR